MNVNFIITCYNREDYIPYLIDIINSYKTIKANYAICYNGTISGFDCHFRSVYFPNGGRGEDGHPSGCPYAEADCELVLGGYDYLKDNGHNLFIKLSADSWLVDENKTIEILNRIEQTSAAYAGNFWYNNSCVSTDICFINTKKHNLFEDMRLHKQTFFDFIYSHKAHEGYERFMGFLTRPYDKVIVLDREPIQSHSTRWRVPSLGWTMSHNLEENVSFMKNYASDNNPVLFSIDHGTGIPFDLEQNKQYI